MKKPQNKDQRISIRFSPSDYHQIKTKANESGRNLARFIRDASLEKPSFQRISPAEFRSLANLANNLQQLTRDAYLTADVLETIRAVRQDLNAVLGKS